MWWLKAVGIYLVVTLLYELGTPLWQALRPAAGGGQRVSRDVPKRRVVMPKTQTRQKQPLSAEELALVEAARSAVRRAAGKKWITKPNAWRVATYRCNSCGCGQGQRPDREGRMPPPPRCRCGKVMQLFVDSDTCPHLQVHANMPNGISMCRTCGRPVVEAG